jgi:thiamine-phosphate pyrophosphorylase
MTDERGGDPVAIAQVLPLGSGIIFRHHATAAQARRQLFQRVRRIARARRLILLLAGPPMQARSWGADGAHHRSQLVSKGLRSVAVHNSRESATARRIGADLIFASPVFASASHPGKRGMGISRLGLLVGVQRAHTIVLGGMNAKNFKRLAGMNVHGWAAVDAFKHVRT